MATPDTEPLPLARLLDNRRLFLNYLERRVGDRATAEDILQDAFVKVVRSLRGSWLHELHLQ